MKTATQPTSITVAVRDLRQILTGFGKITGKSPPGAAAGCIRFIADGSGHADLAATGGGTWASIRLPDAAPANHRAEFLVPIDRLRDFTKPARPGDVVALTPSAGGVEISLGTRSKLVKAPPASEFPSPPAFGGKAHPLPAGAVRAIGEALRCASTDAARQVITGVSLDTSGKGHHIVGTDGRHLYSANSFRLPLPHPAILAPNRLLDWRPVREADGWKLRTLRDKSGRGGSYEITAGAWRITGELVDGDYPVWRQVLPRNEDLASSVRFDPQGLAEIAPAVARLPVAATSANNHPIVVRGDGRAVELLWKESPDEPYQALPVPGTSASGKPFAISIDRRFLAKAFAFGLVEMQVADETSPARFADGEGRQMIVMPQRMASGALPQRRKAAARTKAPKAPKAATTTRRREPQHKPRTKMPKRDQTRKPPTPQAESPIDDALLDLARARDTLREAATGLQSAAAKLKRAKQEQRTADREIRSVRFTLESLRKVRL